MTRINRILLALVAVFAIAAVPALATKPDSPGKSKTAPHGKHKGFGKGVTKLSSGTTTLELDATTLAALTGAGVGVTPAVPATAVGSTFSFPITKGRVHWNKGKKKKTSGYVNHSGGITFTNAARSRGRPATCASCCPRARRCACSPGRRREACVSST